MTTKKSNRLGLKRGIQFWKNSCYIDSTLMLFYYTHRITDTDMNPTSIYYEALEIILDRIRNFPYYCPSKYVKELRRLLELHKNFDGRIAGAFMDVEEFLRRFLKATYQKQFWLSYDNGGRSYCHQVFLGRGEALPRSVSLQQLFDASMRHQGLNFSAFPEPLLIIKTPFCGGALKGFDYIVPNITLAVNVKGKIKSYELIGASSYANHHYTAYVRDLKYRTWMHYNSLGKDGMSQVVHCPYIESWLKHFMNNAPQESDVIKNNQVLAHLCSTMILTLYAPPERISEEYLIEEVDVTPENICHLNSASDYDENRKYIAEYNGGVCGFGPSNLLVLLIDLFARPDSPIIPLWNLSNTLTPIQQRVEVLATILEQYGYVIADCTKALTTTLNTTGLKPIHHNGAIPYMGQYVDPSLLLTFLLHYCNIPNLIRFGNGDTSFLAKLVISQRIKLSDSNTKPLYAPHEIWLKNLDSDVTSVAPIVIFSVDSLLLEKINLRPVLNMKLKSMHQTDKYELFAIVCYFEDNNFGSYRPLGPGDGKEMKWYKNFHLYSQSNQRNSMIQLIKTPDIRHWTSSTDDEDAQIILGKSRLIFYKRISSSDSTSCSFL